MKPTIKVLEILKEEIISSARYVTIPSHYDGGGVLERAIAGAKQEVLDSVADAIHEVIVKLKKEKE